MYCGNLVLLLLWARNFIGSTPVSTERYRACGSYEGGSGWNIRQGPQSESWRKTCFI